MTIEEVKQNIGKMVMSRDAGYKLIRNVQTPHGPYKIVKIDKYGHVVLSGHVGNNVYPDLLTLC